MHILFSFLIGLTLVVGLGPVWIPFFKKLKFGQFIREDGPQAHLAKQGTPTFGGLMFMGSFIIGLLIMWSELSSSAALFILTALMGYGTIGFFDDYIKVVKKNNLGLRAYQKIIGLLMVTGVIAFVYVLPLPITFPFTQWTMSHPLLKISFFAFVAIAITNAVNLTDGIDGLCASVTLVVSLFFSVYSFATGDLVLMSLNLMMSGALVGYLVYNWHPAKVFMGDTGSLALGGYVLANAFILDLAWWIPLFGLVYVLETLSVIIQVFYFKRTGKRFFKMAPLHHHFELLGWKEKQLAIRASLLTLFVCGITLIATLF